MSRSRVARRWPHERLRRRSASVDHPRGTRRLALGRYAGVLAGLLIVCIYLSLTQEVFLSVENWQNIFRSNAVVLILALGMTFVVITAGIDLSVASMTIASGMIFGLSIEPWGVVDRVPCSRRSGSGSRSASSTGS